MTTTLKQTVPLIIRGTLIETDWEEHSHFDSPAIGSHIDELVLSDPLALRDIHDLPLDAILDFLVELGEHLDIDTNVHLQRAVEMTADRSLYSREMLTAIYRHLPDALRRDVLEELIEHNIGRAYLDGWVPTELHDRQVSIRAFGARSVHVIAGNSPLIALQTVINNAIARSDAIIKIPANDPYAAIAIVRTMIEIDPDHPLTRHVSVGYWKGGDRDIEKRIYDSRNIEKIVAWGGFASMHSIRDYLGPGIDLVALDPKLSASIIGRDAFVTADATADAARRAAADIGYFNQGGCVSARVLYVETGTDETGIARANRFGEQVYAELQKLPADLSSPHPAFDRVLRDEIDGIRHAPAFRVFGGIGTEGAVIVSQAEEVVDFSERLDCRVANIVPVTAVEDALNYLTIHTQTIGIYPDALKRQLRDMCALRGGQRIVSLGYATSFGMAGPHDAIQILPRMLRWIRDDTLDAPAGLVHGN
jgi:Acyl-CoA reductase (LuxC)